MVADPTLAPAQRLNASRALRGLTAHGQAEGGVKRLALDLAGSEASFLLRAIPRLYRAPGRGPLGRFLAPRVLRLGTP